MPAAEVRRALLLGGSLPAVAEAALSAARAAHGQAAADQAIPDESTAGELLADAGTEAAGTGAGTEAAGTGAGTEAADAGAEAALAALRAFRLQVGRPLRPMLAASAPTVVAAFDRVSPAAVEWKIDGIRIQVHRQGPEVRVFTRTLDDITPRLPRSPAPCSPVPPRPWSWTVRPSRWTRPAGPGRSRSPPAGPAPRPRPAQETPGVPLTPFFFDLLHLDGRDLIDEPASVRQALMAEVLPEDLLVPRLMTGEVADAEAFFADAVARGHEGVVVKSLDAPYAAGRRGSEWIKVKPVHTLDLVVLAAEWGHGRRRGWLSNLPPGGP